MMIIKHAERNHHNPKLFKQKV